MEKPFLPAEKLAGLSAPVIEKFEAYAKLLTEYNALFNLTAITDPADMAVKHFLDSLTGSEALTQNAAVIDIGSGAGFPGLPLAISRPDLSFTLIDGTGKKVKFLQTVISELGIKNARALHLRAEDAAKGILKGSFDAATARAVAPLEKLIGYAFPLLKKGGKLIAYKGSAGKEVAGAETALKKHGGRVAEVKSFLLDGKYERSLISVIKEQP